MNIGDVVMEKEGIHSGRLVCGSGSYTHAICVSVMPFVLVSQEGDMMWSCSKPEHFVSHGPASAEESKHAFDRFHKRGHWAPPPAANELREFAATG